MKEDKALKKVLKQKGKFQLPNHFEYTLMQAVYQEAEKKKRRSYAVGLITISFVSLSFIVATFFFISPYLDLRSYTKYISFNNPLFQFYSMIGFIALFLLMMESIIRKKMLKHR